MAISGFIAIDVETANADFASVCSVGLALFKDGALQKTLGFLVNPEDEFAQSNVSIHGITEAMVANSPTIREVIEVIRPVISNVIVAHHTPFDRVAFQRAAEKYAMEPLECLWLDTSRVVRHAWPQYAKRGYGLKSVATNLGIEFTHHEAVEDARAAGEILLRAIKDSGLDLEQWLDRSARKITAAQIAKGERIGDFSKQVLLAIIENTKPLVDQTIVFTGDLGIPRKLAEEYAAVAGAKVGSSVTRTTTLLVAGDQDIRKLRGTATSSKYRKAEELIEKGVDLRIVSETDFMRLLAE